VAKRQINKQANTKLQVKYLKTSTLKPNPRNPRKNDPVVERLVRSIEQFGWTNPILCKKDNAIIAGHTRWKAAMESGLETVPVIHLNLSAKDANAYMIADNKLTELAAWDNDLLSDLVRELSETGYDLSLTGIDPSEIEDLIGVEYNLGLTDEDSAPEPPQTPKTMTGDIYRLGDHRLLCGDCTQPESIQTLMDGKLSDMAWTDPPYNVNYKQLPTGNSKRKLKKNIQKVSNYVMNDNMSDEAFYGFLLAAYGSLLSGLKPGGSIYVTHGDSERLNFTKAFVDAGFYFSQALIWVKSSATLSRCNFNWKHEPILFGWRPGAAHNFYGGYCLTSVIDDDLDIDKLTKTQAIELLKKLRADMPDTIIRVDRPSVNDLHPTMKPVNLIERCLEYSSKPGDIVIDAFGGSGSTLIACEKTRRTCYLTEIMPGYCDVIVERWEKYTGQKAERITRRKKRVS